MDDIAEKRVYADRAGGAELLVAGADGVVSVAVSGSQVGRYGFASRTPTTAIAGADGTVAVAGDDDLRLRGADGGFTPTGFGAATAVGVADGDVYAAASDGRIGRLGVEDGGEWRDLGRLDAAVRAIDPPLIATAGGLHRLPNLDYVGLDDAHDVASTGPLAATGSGLYALGNGWMRERDGAFGVCGTDGDRAHAATADRFLVRRDGAWAVQDLPIESPIVDVAYGDVVYAVTADGTVLAEGEEGWRATPLGVDGVGGCALD